MRVAVDGMLLSRCVSGVEFSILNLVEALTEYGVEDYRVFAPKQLDGNAIASDRVDVVASRLPVHWRAVRIFWQQAVLPHAARRGGADLVHAPGYIAPVLSSLPVVITVYDLIAILHPRLCKAANRLHYRLLLPWSIRKARGIVVPSEATRCDVLRRFGVDEKKVRVIPLGVEDAFRVARADAAGAALRERLGTSERFILFVGQHEPKKNLVRLVEAFHHLKTKERLPHRLVLAGKEGWACAPLNRRIRELGLEDDVVRPGFVPGEDLVRLYNMAELFVFPSLYEGFGLPPLEAMACGTPVVCGNRGALPEVAGGAALCVDPYDTGAIAAAMGRVLRDDDLRATLVAAGLARSAEFTWRRTAAATEAFLREIHARARNSNI